MSNQAKRQQDAREIYGLFVMEMKNQLTSNECPSQVLKLALDFLKMYHVDEASTSVDKALDEAVHFPFKQVK
tara:strand:- start:1523 stop:1738 length:216 start_codon:yes stop_codon:yes gene_type:complete